MPQRNALPVSKDGEQNCHCAPKEILPLDGQIHVQGVRDETFLLPLSVSNHPGDGGRFRARGDTRLLLLEIFGDHT